MFLLENGDGLLLENGVDFLDEEAAYRDPSIAIAASTANATGSASLYQPQGAIAVNAHADRLISTTVPLSTTSYTVSFWVRRKSTNPDPAMFWTIDTSSGFYAIGTDVNQRIGITNMGGGYTRPLTLDILAADQWYFVAFKATSATAGALYLGDENNAVTVTSGSLGLTAASLLSATVGGDNIASSFPIADFARFRVWNAQLSDAEIEAERLSVDAPARTANLTASWVLASDATKLVDSSGNGNNLTAPGAGPWENVTPGPSPVIPNSVTLSATTANATSSMDLFYGVFDRNIAVNATTGAATSNIDLNQPLAVAVTATTAAATSFAILAPEPAPLDLSTPMPRITGRPYFGTGADLSDFFDNGYGYSDETWAISAGSWAAVNVGAGPTALLIGLSHDNATGGQWISSSFEEYRIQVSNDSTNGADGTWTTAVTVTGNVYRCREHTVAFTGYSWVKLIIDATSQGQLDEFDIWDASAGTPNTFAFVGDSLTDGALRRYEYLGGGQQPSFQNNVLANRGVYPLQVNLGASSFGVDYWDANIATALAIHPDVKYWCITIGMNDSAGILTQLANFRTKLTNIVNAIISAGKIPIVGRNSWTGSTGYGGSLSYEGSNLKYLNDEGINYVVNNTGVRRGPDLYAHFFPNGTTYNVNSDPHPNEAGYKAWTRAWATNMGVNDPPVLSIAATTGAATSTIGLTFGGNQTLTASRLESTAVQYNPSLALSNALSAPRIESGAVLYGPSLQLSLAAPRIESAAAQYSPSIAATNALAAPRIESGAVQYNPSLTATNALAAPRIDSTAVLYGPTLATTNALAAPRIEGASALYAGQINFGLTAPRIESAAAVYSPSLTVSGSLSAPRIESEAALFNPTLTATNALAAPRIESGAVQYNPSAVHVVAPGLLASSSATYAPSLTATNSLAVPRIESTNTFATHTITNASGLVVPRIESTAVQYNPLLAATNALAAPRIESTAVLYGPALRLALTAPRIESTAVQYNPSAVQNVTPNLLSGGSQLFNPSLATANALAAPRIESSGALYGPTILAAGSALSPPLLGPGTALFAPTVSAGAVSLVAPRIESASALYNPSAQSVVNAPFAASASALFAPATSARSTLLPGLISGTVVLPPAVTTANTITAPRIESAAVQYNPLLGLRNSLATPRIESGAAQYNPSLGLSNALSAPRIESAAILYGPSMRMSLSAPRIESGAAVYAPIVEADIVTPLIGPSAVVYPPSLGGDNSVLMPFVGSSAVTFGPQVNLRVEAPLLPGGTLYAPGVYPGLGYSPAPVTLPLIKALELPLPETLTQIVGIHQSDVIIRSAIEAGLADMRANVWLLDYVFASLPQDALTWKEYGEKDLQAAKKWFLTTHIPVVMEPHLDVAKLPSIAIGLVESSEVAPEATIGDVNYDPYEDNDRTWPALTPAFTPSRYTPSSGLVELPAESGAYLAPGMFIVDRRGNAYEIKKVNSQRQFLIDTGLATIPDFRGAVIKSRRPGWKVSVESSSFKETYSVTVYTVGEVATLTWLHAIVQFCLLRYKQVLLEARGFERSTIASGPVRNDDLLQNGEMIYSRNITVSGHVRQFWPKTVSPVLDAVVPEIHVSGAIRVSGQNADVSARNTGDNLDEALWVGNLDSIRRR